jgi:signal transduction histidine kinase
MQSLELTVPADVTAPREARRQVSGFEAIPAELKPDAMLLVSELVSNAVRHGPHSQKSIRVRLTAGYGTLRVEVQDSGRTFQAGLGHQLDSPGGMGLRLLQELTERWGVETSPETMVWFEMNLT